MGTQDEGAGEGNTAPASDPKKDAIYEDRPTSKKIIRVVTVIAYMISVSFVAIVLSAYYVFLWQPPNPRLMHRAHLRADPQIEYLVDKPPTEVTINESLSKAEIRDKVNVFREEILRNRGINITRLQQTNLLLREKNFNVDHMDNVTLTNATNRNNSRESGAMWNPIVRAWLATTENPTTQIALRKSTDVYKSLNVEMKSSSVTERLRDSTMFMPEINESFSFSFSSSPSSSSSSLPEGDGKLNNVSVNNLASTADTGFTAEDVRDVKENRSSSQILGEFSSVTDSSIKEISPTRAYQLLGNLRSTESSLDRVGSSGTDEYAAGTTIGTSATVEKNTVWHLGSFGRSSPPKISQGLDGINTASGRRRDDLSNALELVSRPSNFIGSHISRVSTKSHTNETELHEKHRTNFPSEKQAPIEIVPDATRDFEPVLNSPASIVPAVVQPNPESIGTEQE